MSTMSQFFGSAMLSQQLFTASATWTAPVAGMYQVTAIGGGASGSVGPSEARSGGAGGAVVSLFSFAAGQTLTLTVGAGGASTTNSSGIAGGDTTVTGAGITTMTAGGATAPENIPNINSVGGTASGGNNINAAGGDGVLSAVAVFGGSVSFLSGTLVGVFSATGAGGTLYGGGGQGNVTGSSGAGRAGCVLIEFLIPA
jgi:hypothetical protein